LFLPIVVPAMKDFDYFGGSESLDHLWEVICLAFAATGLLVRVLTVGYAPADTSGRNTREQKATALNTTGLYSIVRHPLYLGNFLIWLGVSLFPHLWWFALIAILAFWIYYERIMFAEEEFLRTKFGAAFEEWAAQTPAFFPDLRGWRSPILAFSWKTALAREYSTLFATIVTFFFLEVAGDFFAGKMPHVDLGWLLLLAVGCVVYILLRWMKKRKLLWVDGR
jgi:protein-S-isoprenylcysteine O-methyltransferase Ste14